MRIIQRFINAGPPAGDAKFFRQRGDFLCVTTNENGVGHQAVTVGQLHAALLPDLHNRSNQMLVFPHSSGNAMHDNANWNLSHLIASQ
ncbi:hypothetical protein [Erwinia sp. E_sp_B01_9]|uniref:hypothetical protein n=1 Tax=Erwinia sp. E_sp_B01_9 TaxID=3039403 RepID=UPI003D9BF366